MNIEDYKKVYSALKSKDGLLSSIDDVIVKLNIKCYDAAKQAIFDVSHNKMVIKKAEDDSKKCSSLRECLSYGSYIGIVLSYRKPDFLDLFIEENEAVLSRFPIKKFLGSGQVGDVWELEDNKILKIFDNSVQNDIAKYEQAREATGDHDAPSYDISIYELGRLKVPDKYFGIKTPSFSYIGRNPEDKPEYAPAYVILERLTTYSGIVRTYTRGLEGSSILPEPLVKSGLPNDKSFQDAILGNDNPDFIVDIFMTYIGDIIIQGSIRGWYDNTTSNYSGRVYPMDLDSILSQKSGLPFLDRRQKISALAKMYMEEVSADPWQLPEPKFFNAYMSILKSAKPDLPDDWLFRLAESTISKLELGHKDVHTGNVGIRAEGDLSFVYYDS